MKHEPIEKSMENTLPAERLFIVRRACEPLLRNPVQTTGPLSLERVLSRKPRSRIFPVKHRQLRSCASSSSALVRHLSSSNQARQPYRPPLVSCVQGSRPVSSHLASWTASSSSQPLARWYFALPVQAFQLAIPFSLPFPLGLYHACSLWVTSGERQPFLVAQGPPPQTTTNPPNLHCYQTSRCVLRGRHELEVTRRRLDVVPRTAALPPPW